MMAAFVAVLERLIATFKNLKLRNIPPAMNTAGPIAAARDATTTTKRFVFGLNLFNRLAKFANPSTIGTMATATISPMEMPNPSIADSKRLPAPKAVSPMMSAISFAAPAEFFSSCVNGLIWSTPPANTSNADCACRPTSSFASARFNPCFAKSFNASAVGLPDAPISEMIRRNAVPACEPLMPALDIICNIAEVSSMDIPALFATGATNFIASAKVSISRADELNDDAITSVTRPVSLASNPNARNVEPATSAARAKSLPDACANANVDSVTLVISFAVKPSLANSVCRLATSRALNIVLAPNSLALSDKALNSSAVAPDTACTLAISASNPLNTLNDTAPNATIGAVTFADIFFPNCCILRPVLSNARSALFRPLRNGAMFAVNR